MCLDIDKEMQMIETKLYDLETDPFEASIAEAGKVIARGGIVVFPTETVYGLGADAMNAGAVAKIFEAKGRPGDNPLIVHVSDLAQVETLVKAVPEKAKRLAEAFWPGPLTLIMARSDRVPDRVTAGLSTVAGRTRCLSSIIFSVKSWSIKGIST